MCTAMIYKTKASYFGRNLDLEYSYNETVTIAPRNYSFNFKNTNNTSSKYAIIGMAYVKDDYPLYYDAMNEAGVAIAGLNFPYNAHYNDIINEKINISPFEFIPYILSVCTTVVEAKRLLEDVNIINVGFSDELPLTPLHWIIADKDTTLIVESVRDGLKVFNNAYGVLTNNPPYEKQIVNFAKYSHLTATEKGDTKCDENFSRATGAIGLPGDWSSTSRFVKAAFLTKHSRSGDSESESVGQFFHMLSAVEMPKGCIRLDGGDEITQYSSCCNLNCGKYYYTTYTNRQITCIDMYKEDINSDKLISFPLHNEESIFHQN